MTLNQQQIIALAVESGAVEMVTTAEKEVVCFDAIAAQRFYQEAYQHGVRDEREACAKVCDLEANEARMVRKVEGDLVGLFLGHRVSALDAAAAAIRARSVE